MLAIAFRLFGEVFVWACLASLAVLFFSLAIWLRLLPHLLRGVLILSFRLYSFLLVPIAEPMRADIGVDILDGFWRVICCLLLSGSFGLLLLVVLGLPITVWSVGLCLLHGLVVGLAWDEIQQPGGLQLGTKIK
jgi:hypothetical protein